MFEKQCFYCRAPGYGALKKYLTADLEPLYQRLGFNVTEGDGFLDKKLRNSVVDLMCDLDYDSCTDEAVRQFQAWMAESNPDEKNGIDPSSRNVVYCKAIEKGNEEEWDFLWQRYLKANNAYDKTIILNSLACTREVWLLQRYLDMTLDSGSGIRKQDGTTVISRTAKNIIGRYVTWNWIRGSWKDIIGYFDTAIRYDVRQTMTLRNLTLAYFQQ